MSHNPPHALDDAGRLARNSISLTHIVFFVIAAAAPLAAVIGATPAGFAFGNGAGVPGAFVLVGLLYLVFISGFTAMTRYVGDSGAFYVYIAKGLGWPAGVGGAMIAIVTYTAIQIAIYALFGVFLGGTLARFGLDLPWWACALAAVVLVFALGQRNVALSGRVLGLCLVAEITILMVLNISIVLSGGGPEGLSFTSFTPSTVLVPSLGVTLVFVVGSFIGFEAATIFAGEADNPERTIPRATYIAVTLIALFYAFSTWSIVQFYGPSQVSAAALGDLDNFYFNAVGAKLGGWAVELANVLLITSLFACVLSIHSTIARYLHALASEGVLPRAITRVHPRHASPYVAGAVQSVMAALIVLAFMLGGQDPYSVVFAWMAALGVIGILAVQVLVSLAVIVFFRRQEQSGGLWSTLLAPSLSILGLLALLWLVVTNLTQLAGSDSPVVIAFPYVIVAVGLFGAALARQRKSPGHLAAPLTREAS